MIKNEVINFIELHKMGRETYDLAILSYACEIENGRNTIFAGDQNYFVEDLDNFSTSEAFRILDTFNKGQDEAYLNQLEINKLRVEEIHKDIEEREFNRQPDDNTIYSDSALIQQAENDDLHFCRRVEF
ncbi:MAG: hypothetical protein ACOCZ5_01665 [bacterium]